MVGSTVGSRWLPGKMQPSIARSAATTGVVIVTPVVVRITSINKIFFIYKHWNIRRTARHKIYTIQPDIKIVEAKQLKTHAIMVMMMKSNFIVKEYFQVLKKNTQPMPIVTLVSVAHAVYANKAMVCLENKSK